MDIIIKNINTDDILIEHSNISFEIIKKPELSNWLLKINKSPYSEHSAKWLAISAVITLLSDDNKVKQFSKKENYLLV